MSNNVNYSQKEGVAYLAINDGKLNIMSVAMLQALNTAVTRAEEEAELLVIRSSIPGIFSAGFDVTVLANNDAQQSFEMVRAGAELALRLMALPIPTLGVMEGQAFPMGAFLLLACDLRIATEGPWRIGLNEVAIGITPPTFAIELARSRLHPAWLSRTVTLGEMFEHEEAAAAGFVDKIEPPGRIEQALAEAVSMLESTHSPSHISAKHRLRADTMGRMRRAIDAELTLEAYQKRGASKALD